MRRDQLIFFVIVSLLCTQCASLISGSYQYVDITADTVSTILVNGEEPPMVRGLYRVKKDNKPLQVEVKKEGFKSEYFTLSPTRRNPLRWMPVATISIPSIFFVPIFIAPVAFLSGFALMSWDKAPNAYLFPKENAPISAMMPLPKRKGDMKNLYLEQVKVDIEEDSITYKYYKNHRYYKHDFQPTIESGKDEVEAIQIENTIFRGMLNDILLEQGFIDTTNRVFRNTYSNSLSLNATIQNYSVDYVGARKGTMNNCKLGIKWEILNTYDEVVFTMNTTSRSGNFVYDEENIDFVSDAVSAGFIQFMASPKVAEIFSQKGIIDTVQYDELRIPGSNKYVSNLNQAVLSSLTLKSDDGHASGFVITPNGYIITNYHAVSDTNGLVAVLHDNSEYEVEIVRVDRVMDLALLKIDAEGFIPFKIDGRKSFDLATEIYTIGTPTAEDLPQTVSKGIISGLRTTNEGLQYIQTDASVSSGNSGGVIISDNASVIGVVASKIIGLGVEGIAFGIPAYNILDRLSLKIE